MNRKPQTYQPAAAFTLIEVLVASAVLAIVLVILLGTLTTSMTLWRNTEGKLASDREGRSAELLIASDLSSVVMPTNPNLWPFVTTNGGLQFLTSKSVDYQGGDGGDVCFVEYYVDQADGELKRIFYSSSRTFTDIIKPGSFPGAVRSSSGDLLADNVLDRAADAVRGLKLYTNVYNTNFVILNTNMVSLQGTNSSSNRPAAIEINLGVADPTSMDPKNKQIWQGNTNIVLRNAGIYSFRIDLPKPENKP